MLSGIFWMVWSRNFDGVFELILGVFLVLIFQGVNESFLISNGSRSPFLVFKVQWVFSASKTKEPLFDVQEFKESFCSSKVYIVFLISNKLRTLFQWLRFQEISLWFHFLIPILKKAKFLDHKKNPHFYLFPLFPNSTKNNDKAAIIPNPYNMNNPEYGANSKICH